MMFTLEELAKKHNQIARPSPQGDKYKGKHSVAATVHGWPSFEFNYGPVMLSEDDYLQALDSAQQHKKHPPANRRGATINFGPQPPQPDSDEEQE